MKKVVSLISMLSLLGSALVLSSCSLFGIRVDEYHFPDRGLRNAVSGYVDKDNNGYSIIARGILNDKCGCAIADVWNKDKAAWLVKEIVANARVIENDDPVFIFEGSEKYHKVNTFNKALEIKEESESTEP